MIEIDVPAMTLYFAVLLYALAGGWVYRIRGGMPPSLFGCGKLCDRNLYALGLTLPCFLLAPWYAALAAHVLTFAAVSKGHGDWQGFGHQPSIDRDEWANVILRLIMREEEGYLHDYLGMTFSGVLITLAPAAVLGWYADPLWLLLLPVGALKATAYLIGWMIYDRWGAVGRDIVGLRHISYGTGTGEFLTGVFQWGGTGILYIAL